MLFAVWSFDLCVTVFLLGWGCVLYWGFVAARKVTRSNHPLAGALKQGATNKALSLIKKWLG
jgi:hypothetical protein